MESKKRQPRMNKNARADAERVQQDHQPAEITTALILYKKSMIKDVYEELLACDIRVNTFIDENTVFKPPKFGEAERHFLSEPLKRAMKKVLLLE